MDGLNLIRVLLVDDDEDDFVMIRDMLSDLPGKKHVVDYVSSYGDAMAEITKNAHDVYLFDYRLGEKTGLDLMKETVEARVRVPLILLTGHGDQAVDVLGGAEHHDQSPGLE